MLAFFVPPLAVFFASKPFQALLNLGLTTLLWFPGAILVVKDHKADKRMEKQVELMKQQ
ncbi:YqaE/Pmp3 family membrane protein [Halolactibacillus halophilus]|uniref:YqaE/Pmp3 family membrane protein n=1 Tax=Halolactibacillus halophilus TaxID=306540 RepID=UPI0035A21DCE